MYNESKEVIMEYFGGHRIDNVSQRTVDIEYIKKRIIELEKELVDAKKAGYQDDVQWITEEVKGLKKRLVELEAKKNAADDKDKKKSKFKVGMIALFKGAEVKLMEQGSYKDGWWVRVMDKAVEFKGSTYRKGEEFILYPDEIKIKNNAVTNEQMIYKTKDGGKAEIKQLTEYVSPKKYTIIYEGKDLKYQWTLKECQDEAKELVGP